MPTKQEQRFTSDQIVPKDDLIHLIAGKAGLSLTDTRTVVDAFAAVVCEEVAKGKAVRLLGFGTWVRQKVAGHPFIPIRGTEKVELPAHHKIRFHTGSLLAKAAQE